MYFNIYVYYTVMLRSTTGSYGRPVKEVAYGEILFHSIEAVCEMVAQKEWLRCRHEASPMFDIPGSTLVWVQYILFFGFPNIKTYMYYVFKIYICTIKKNWQCLILSWPDKVQRMISTVHEFLNESLKPTDDL